MRRNSTPILAAAQLSGRCPLGNSHKIVNASTLLLAGGLFGMQSAGFQNEMKRQ